MPLIVEGCRLPPRWAEKAKWAGPGLDRFSCGRADRIRIALVNNMPDSALEDTELQFFDLLRNAAAEIPVSIKLFSLPGVPRGDEGQNHLSGFYSPIENLLEDRFDGAIITGTEPHQANLRNEPFWDPLKQVLDWADRNTSSTVLSCLAAHAAALYRDGIERRPLSDKQFGVFEYDRASRHVLTSGSGDVLRFPHSRWNEVREEELSASGYVVVTKSQHAGVDLFVKQTRSLFVHFQGHPEYEARTLLKEYRRDIRRFLKHERESYPTMPQGYFDQETTKLLDEFRENALVHRHEALVTVFPEAVASERLQRGWAASANCIYRNWLGFMAEKKANAPSFVALTQTKRALRPEITAG